MGLDGRVSAFEALFLTIGGLTIAFLLDCVHMVWLWNLKKNRFETSRGQGPAFNVRSDFGDFAIDGQRQVLRMRTAEGSAEIPLELIDRFDFAFRAERAWWNDWVWGAKPHEDLMQWYVVSIVTANRLVPLFEVGQYLPGKPILKRVFDVQMKLLSRLGLLRDGEKRAREVLQELQQAFAAAGHAITLTPRGVKDMTGA